MPVKEAIAGEYMNGTNPNLQTFVKGVTSKPYSRLMMPCGCHLSLWAKV